MGAKLNSEKLGKFYKAGKKTSTRREWRGFKDTMYDFGCWLKNLLVMGKFIMKPTTIKALFTYRWFGNYMAAFDYIDRHLEGVRGPQLRIGHKQYDSIVGHLTQTMDTLFKCDKRIGNKHGKYDELNKKVVIMDENGMMVVAMGFPNLKFVSKEVPAIYTGSTIAQDGVLHYIEVSEEFQIPSDVCPMPCAELGCAIDEDFPICGVCAIHCNTTCDGSLMGNQIEDRHDDLPSFTMAAPMRHQQASVLPYSRDQVVAAIKFIEEHTGEKWDWDAFAKNCKTYNAQNALFDTWLEMNKTPYPQICGNNIMLYRDAEYMVISGRDASFLKLDQEITDLAKKGYENKVLAAKEIRHRAIVWGVHAQYYTAFNQWLANCWGIVTLCDMLSFTLTKPINYEDHEQAMLDLGEYNMNMIMRNHSNGGYEVGVEQLWQYCEEYNADMVLMYEHIGCKSMAGYHGLIEEEGRKRGIHIVWVYHALMNPTKASRKDMRNDVNRYMQTVLREEPLDPTIVDFDDTNRW